MDCTTAESLMSRMIFDELEESVKKELSEHLEECPKCAELLADMRATVGLLREGLEAGPAPVLSDARRAALLARGAELSGAGAGAGAAGARAKRAKVVKGPWMSPGSYRTIGAVAAVLILTVGVVGLFSRRMAPPPPGPKRDSSPLAIKGGGGGGGGGGLFDFVGDWFGRSAKEKPAVVAVVVDESMSMDLAAAREGPAPIGEDKGIPDLAEAEMDIGGFATAAERKAAGPGSGKDGGEKRSGEYAGHENEFGKATGGLGWDQWATPRSEGEAGSGTPPPAPVPAAPRIASKEESSDNLSRDIGVGGGATGVVPKIAMTAPPKPGTVASGRNVDIEWEGRDGVPIDTKTAEAPTAARKARAAKKGYAGKDGATTVADNYETLDLAMKNQVAPAGTEEEKKLKAVQKFAPTIASRGGVDIAGVNGEGGTAPVGEAVARAGERARMSKKTGGRRDISVGGNLELLAEYEEDRRAAQVGQATEPLKADEKLVLEESVRRGDGTVGVLYGQTKKEANVDIDRDLTDSTKTHIGLEQSGTWGNDNEPVSAGVLADKPTVKAGAQEGEYSLRNDDNAMFLSTPEKETGLKRLGVDPAHIDLAKVEKERDEVLAQHHANVAKSQYKEFEYEKAREEAKKALQLNPKSEDALETLEKTNTMLDIRKGRTREYEKREYEIRSADIEKTRAQAAQLYREGKELFSEGKYDESIAKLKEVREISALLPPEHQPEKAKEAEEELRLMERIRVAERNLAKIEEWQKRPEKLVSARGNEDGDKRTEKKEFPVSGPKEMDIKVADVLVRAEPVDGEVLAVNGDTETVVLSVGRNARVEKGMSLALYRDDKFVSDMVVTNVFPEKATGRLIRSHTMREVRPGDNVTNRFGGGELGEADAKALKEKESELAKERKMKLETLLDKKKISFSFQDASVSKVLGYISSLSARELAVLKKGDKDPKITVNAEKVSLRTALDSIARNAGMKWEIRDGQIRFYTETKEEKKEDAEKETDEDASLIPVPVFRAVPVNPFVMAARDRFSTFSIDVDTASYTLARNYINRGYLPPAASVRMEEYVNAFDYNYVRQTGKVFTVQSEAAPAPFGKGLTLLKVGVRGKVLGREGRKAAHLVFVVDSSGSMAKSDRMALVQYALTVLAERLNPTDWVSLVTYGTDARLAMEAVKADRKKEIVEAIESIQCGGSTNLIAGLELGYSLARRHFRSGQINRVILCSDGVANVGLTEAGDMLKKVEMYKKHGITFTGVGFGMGTYNDELLEKLANRGDGNYVFCDSRKEARRIFIDEMAATLQTIARDVKIQVEFNPHRVRRYRLIGYENRDIADKDFRNDAIDAGEVGSGQSATALYELELFGEQFNPGSGEHLGKVYVRYRDVDTGKVEEISHRLDNEIIAKRTPETSPRFYLAACAAEFAEILRASEHARDGNIADVRYVLEKTAAQLTLDTQVQELLHLVRTARGLPRAG